MTNNHQETEFINQNNLEQTRERSFEFLRNLQSFIREGLKGGKKPNIPVDIEYRIINTVNSVIDDPQNNVLVSVLPEYREEAKNSITRILEVMAKELKRANSLSDSFFNDSNILALMTEILFINLEQIRFSISKGESLSHSFLEQLARIATYHDSEFIDNFLNKDNLIAQVLGISPDEARENFSKSLRLRFAINNISNPLEALRRVKHHLDYTLTDENIAKELGITQSEAQEYFPRGVRLHFAVHNISDPLEALRKVKHHLDYTLTDENIARALGITPSEAQEYFSRGVRLYFAVHHISDPLDGLNKWLDGKIVAPFKRPPNLFKKE